MEFNKKYGPYALQIYLYLAKNANNYSLALSQQAAWNEAGIAKTTFHKYVNLLIDEGYLVWRSGNTYDFYETPHKQEEEKMGRSPCGGSCLQDEQRSSRGGGRSSPQTAKSPWENIEIDNIQTDRKDMSTDSSSFERNQFQFW